MNVMSLATVSGGLAENTQIQVLEPTDSSSGMRGDKSCSVCECKRTGKEVGPENSFLDRTKLDSLPYESFEQTADGDWRPVRPMVIELEGTGKISVGPWLSFKRGRKLMGHDIALWLDEQSDSQLDQAA